MTEHLNEHLRTMKNTLLVTFLTMFSVSSFAQGHKEISLHIAEYDVLIKD